MPFEHHLVARFARGLEASALSRSPSRSTCSCYRVRLAAQINALERRRFSQTHLRQADEQASRTQAQSPPLPPAPTAKQLQAIVQQVNRGGFARGIVEGYATFGSTERLFKQFLKQADYTVPNALKKPAQPAPKNDAGEDIGEGTGVWFASKSKGGMELPVTFGNWAQVMILHMYILIVRMRAFTDKKQLRSSEQQLLDHFSYAAEEKMEKYHGMAARGVRNKHLKDLWLQYRGVMLSYDEGLARGDAVLAAAIWRSIFQGDENANVADIALVVAYLRREVHRLETVSDVVVMSGGYGFGDLATLRQNYLNGKSHSKDTPLSPQEESEARTRENMPRHAAI